MTEIRGIPDQSACPSLQMNFQTVATIGCQAGAAAGSTWSFGATLLPHPLAFLSCLTSDTTGFTPSNVLNGQIVGGTIGLKSLSLAQMARRWRLTHMSVTVYQDGPDLANQGTLVVSQQPFSTLIRHGSGIDRQANYIGLGVQCYTKFFTRVAHYDKCDMPDFPTSQAMPNSYFNNSKFGAYVPLKLTKTHQQWQSPETNHLVAANTDIVGAGLATYTGTTLPSVGYTGTWPFYDAAGATSNPNNVADLILGDNIPCMCNDWIANISAKNLATTTSYSFFIRAGYEVQVYPGNPMSTQLRLSPPYDPAALAAYFQISREMKDAYPADYNDAGKILNVIGDIALSAAPFLLKVPEIGVGLAAGAGMLGVGSKAVARALSAHSKSIASAGDTENARDVIQNTQKNNTRASKNGRKKLAVTRVKAARKRITRARR